MDETLGMRDQLDAIVERLDRIEEALEKNIERTEISASFVAEIHATWEIDTESGKTAKPKTHITAGNLIAGNRVSWRDRYSNVVWDARIGSVVWLAVDDTGHVVATVAWDDGETQSALASNLGRVVTPGT